MNTPRFLPYKVIDPKCNKNLLYFFNKLAIKSGIIAKQKKMF